MKKISYIMMTLASIMVLAGCRHTSSEAVPLHRFDKVLFDTPAEQLPAKLASVAGEFNTTLLNVQPGNPEYMQMLSGFVADPVMQDIYRIVDSVFGDMRSQSEELGAALKRAQELCPAIRYDKVYTFVSGIFDYNMRIGCNDHELIISLDQYILPYTKRYGYFDNPMFLVNQSRPEYMVADCMTSIARQRIAIPQESDMTLLDYMISEGKAIYFAQQTLPGTPDSILMRYTDAQLKWMERNESNVWSFFMQNKLLYEIDYMRFHNFIDDAPKTNAFRDSSPRTTDFIGWRIVSQYMKNNNVSMQQLFDETDSQKILSQSGYRPK